MILIEHLLVVRCSYYWLLFAGVFYYREKLHPFSFVKKMAADLIIEVAMFTKIQ